MRGCLLLALCFSPTAALLRGSSLRSLRARPLRAVATMATFEAWKPPEKIVICGAGLHGSALAYYLTKAGHTDVTVVERKEVAAAASGKGGGFLARDWGSGPTVQLHKVEARSRAPDAWGTSAHPHHALAAMPHSRFVACCLRRRSLRICLTTATLPRRHGAPLAAPLTAADDMSRSRRASRCTPSSRRSSGSRATAASRCLASRPVTAARARPTSAPGSTATSRSRA